MGKRLEKTGSFVASDAFGNHHDIDIFAGYSEVTEGGGLGEIPVSVHLMTRDGQLVNHDSPRKYTIVAFGIKLRSNDPSAP